MTRIYEESELIRRLSAVGRLEKTAFAAACAERLLPLFQRYALKTGRDSLPLAKALADVWRVAASGSEGDDLAPQGQVAEGLVPDDEDPAWVWESGYAQNAAASVAYAARTWLTDDPQQAAWAARQVYEAAHHAAQQHLTERDLDAPQALQLLEDPMVQTAIDGIEADLALVEQEGHDAVGALRERASREASSWTSQLPWTSPDA